MKLADYKKALKGLEVQISNAANAVFARDWRIGAIGALNHALTLVGLPSEVRCHNEGTANSVLHYCDRKAGR